MPGQRTASTWQHPHYENVGSFCQARVNSYASTSLLASFAPVNGLITAALHELAWQSSV